MSKERKPHEAFNMKQLYNKKYGDIVHVGRARKYTPEQAFEMAIKYFEWAELNAIKAAETSSFQGKTYQDEIHKPRIFTLTGLKLFCSWSDPLILGWRKEPGYSEVMEFIDSVIFEQKFQLAANGIVNAAFISKDLGIDKGDTFNINANANAEAESNSEEAMEKAVMNVLSKI